MGGSGGNDFTFDLKRFQALLSEAEKGAEESTFSESVNALFGDALRGLNDRNVEAVEKHINALIKALDKDVNGTIDLRFGGSLAKRTYAEGISDIDALVILNRTDLQQQTPNEICDYFFNQVKNRLPESVVGRDGFAVYVCYSDGTRIELVPALRTESGGYKIPSSDCSGWVATRPDLFAEKLKNVNQSNNARVIPVIKLSKQILGNLPSTLRPTGYHLETLAVHVFENYEGPRSYKTMVEHFFAQASQLVLTPLPDITGQSASVDGGLGSAQSDDRLRLSNALARASRAMRMANVSKSIEHWDRILEGDI